MSDLLANLWMGFQVAGNPFNILFCLLGALVGTLVGVLPGVGSVATIAMLLPITFGLPPVGALIMLGLMFAVVLAKGSVLKAVAMVLTGLLLSMVGSDLETGAGRMTFDIPELADGIGFANIAMGVFGFAEIIRNLELPPESRDIVQAKITGLMPTRKDLIDSAGAIVRGTALGSLLGILPGGGAVIASFAAYTFEKKVSNDPSRFGRGAIEGVADPESANNAAAQTSFIPL